ncbi:MAG: YidC/Oxa1 family membrane protein insertase [Candidatus Pacebacteria bacterium]|nr:YidC/Oxa1 family membrane protein insertase [Candidatus Paceibacterota bacterium]
MSGIFSTIFYQPLYNALVFILSVVPGGNVGVALIVLTVAVRFLLLPFAHKSVVSQHKMREIAPHIEKLKQDHKDDKQEQARRTMELYKEHGINPFSGCLLLFIQLPIIIALYWVFSRGLPNLDTASTLLYSFVHLPASVGTAFLGINLSGKSFILAALAAITQYFQIKLSMPATPAVAKGSNPSFKDDFSRSLNLQMRFMLPLVVFFISYSISAAIALYWTTTNLFSVVHFMYVKRKAEEVKK